jgi:hypothetical protein
VQNKTTTWEKGNINMTNDPEKLTGIKAIMRDADKLLSKLESNGFNRTDIIVYIILFVCLVWVWFAKYSVGFALYVLIAYAVFSFYLMNKNRKR